MKIYEKEISTQSPTYFIAEIGSNYDGDLERAKDLIKIAADSDADAVKFQHYTADSLVSDKGFEKLSSEVKTHQSKWKDSVSKIDLVVEQLYIEAKKQHPKYPGSDLYSFLRNDLPSLILPDYNNRLLILTDGYVYMSKSNPSRVGNKLGHLEGPFLDPLRNKTDWIERFKNGDWGLVHSGVNFTNLDVLCLQFVPDCINNSKRPRTNLRPLKPCLNEFDILKKMWVEWFAKMGVNDISILSKSQNITPSVNAINIFLTQD